MNIGRKLKGFAVMLLSLILLIGFDTLRSISFRWRYVFSFTWSEVWMIVGFIGFVMVVWDGKKQDKAQKGSSDSETE